MRSEVAHLVVMFSPGGAEQFFIDAGLPAAAPGLPPDDSARDRDRIRAAAAKNGLVLLGPPPFADITR